MQLVFAARRVFDPATASSVSRTAAHLPLSAGSGSDRAGCGHSNATSRSNKAQVQVSCRRGDLVFRNSNKIEIKILLAGGAISSRYGTSPSRSPSENSRNVSHDRRPRSRNLRLLHPCLSSERFDSPDGLLRWRSGRTFANTGPVNPESNSDTTRTAYIALVFTGRRPGKEGGP
jgi:hypothetical protein